MKKKLFLLAALSMAASASGAKKEDGGVFRPLSVARALDHFLGKKVVRENGPACPQSQVLEKGALPPSEENRGPWGSGVEYGFH